jgi:hypothetical protein
MTILRIAVIALFGLALLAELYAPHKPKFGFDAVFGFYAMVGLAGCVCFVVVSLFLGFLLGRGDVDER